MTEATITIKGKSSEEIAKAYASPSWWYDVRGFFILTFSYRDTLWSQVNFFNANMGQQHLEAAIGSGTLLGIQLNVRKIFRKAQIKITGFDYAEKMLAGARQRFRKRNDIELIKADVARLPYPEQHFDTINIANAVHCFPDIQAGMTELYRVLKEGGTLSMNVLLYPKGKGLLDRISNRINGWGIKKGILVTPYTQEQIQQICLSAGFRITSERVKGNALYVSLEK